MIIKNHLILTTNDMYNNNDIQENDIIMQNNVLSDIIANNTKDIDARKTSFIEYVKHIERNITLLKKEKGTLVCDENLTNILTLLDELCLNTSKRMMKFSNEFICITLRSEDNVYCNRCFSLNKLHPRRESTVTLAELIYFWSKEIDTIFLAIATYHRQTKKEYLQNRKTKDETYIPCARIERLTLKTNVLICSIKLNSKYPNLTATEVWNLIQEENKEFFNAFDVMVTSDDSKLQICLKIESFLLRTKQSKLMWKMLNEAFNDILKNYGTIKYYVNDITQALCIYSRQNNIDDIECGVIKYFSEEVKIHDVKYLVKTFRKYSNHLDIESEKYLIRDNNKVLKAINNHKPSKDDSTLFSDDLLQDFEENKQVEEHKDIQKSKAGKKGKAIMLKNRKKDIYIYCERRNRDLGAKRKDTLYVYGKIILNCHLNDREGLKKQLLKLNNYFKESLNTDEIDKIVDYLENSTSSSIKNSTIMKILEFTDDDIKEMHSSYSTEHLKEKARLRKTRQREKQKKKNIEKNILTEKEKKTKRQLLILEKNKDLSNNVLIEVLKVSPSTLTRLKNQLKLTA